MRVEVTVYFTLREKLGWSSRWLELSGTRLRDVIEALPKLRDLLLSNGDLSPEFRVLIDGRNAVFLGGLEAEVRDGSRIVIFPPAGGG
jgi:molybdopterin converting factor small subunit